MVPVAAVLLTAATIGRLASARVVAPKPLAARELWIMGLMVVPVVLVLFAPVTTLGAFSADKRAGFSGTGFATSSGDIGSGELTLVDVASAETSPEGERALAKRAGETVRFVGFVSIRDDTPADEFLLARYVVSCCVADATIAEVRVVNVTPGQFANEDWVEVTGTIYPIGREVIVDAGTAASRRSRAPTTRTSRPSCSSGRSRSGRGGGSPPRSPSGPRRRRGSAGPAVRGSARR